MRHCTRSFAPRIVRLSAEYELVDSLPVLAGLAHSKLRQPLIKPRQQDAGLEAMMVLLFHCVTRCLTLQISWLEMYPHWEQVC